MTTAEPGYASPQIDDDLDVELLPLRRRPRLPLVTALLAVAAVTAGAFIGGVEIQKHYGGGTSSSGGSAGAVPARFGAASAGANLRTRARNGGLPATGAFGGASGGFTSGLVTLIKGSTLYVTDFSGNTVKVATTRSSQISKTSRATLRAIHPGDAVVVRGATQRNGSVKASSITIGNAGAGSQGAGSGG